MALNPDPSLDDTELFSNFITDAWPLDVDGGHALYGEGAPTDRKGSCLFPFPEGLDDGFWPSGPVAEPVAQMSGGPARVTPQLATPQLATPGRISPSAVHGFPPLLPGYGYGDVPGLAPPYMPPLPVLGCPPMLPGHGDVPLLAPRGMSTSGFPAAAAESEGGSTALGGGAIVTDNNDNNDNNNNNNDNNNSSSSSRTPCGQTAGETPGPEADDALKSPSISKRGRPADDQNDPKTVPAAKRPRAKRTGPARQGSVTQSTTLAVSLPSGQPTTTSLPDSSRHSPMAQPAHPREPDRQAQPTDDGEGLTSQPEKTIDSGTVHRRDLGEGRTRYTLQYSVKLGSPALEALSGRPGAFCDQSKLPKPDFSQAATIQPQGVSLKAVKAGDDAAFELEFTTTPQDWWSRPEGRLLALLKDVHRLSWAEVYFEFTSVFSEDTWNLDDLQRLWKTKSGVTMHPCLGVEMFGRRRGAI